MEKHILVCGTCPAENNAVAALLKHDRFHFTFHAGPCPERVTKLYAVVYVVANGRVAPEDEQLYKKLISEPLTKTPPLMVVVTGQEFRKNRQAWCKEHEPLLQRTFPTMRAWLGITCLAVDNVLEELQPVLVRQREESRDLVQVSLTMIRFP